MKKEHIELIIDMVNIEAAVLCILFVISYLF